jgi:hypothetical protein
MLRNKICCCFRNKQRRNALCLYSNILSLRGFVNIFSTNMSSLTGRKIKVSFYENVAFG